MSTLPRFDDHRVDDDPILTAYALGELDPDEARAVEARLADDEAARAYVEGVRATAIRLSAALRAEPAPAESAAAPVANDLRLAIARRRSRWPIALAAAAALAAVGITTWLALPNLTRGRSAMELATADEADVRLRDAYPVEATGALTEDALARRDGRGGARNEVLSAESPAPADAAALGQSPPFEPPLPGIPRSLGAPVARPGSDGPSNTPARAQQQAQSPSQQPARAESRDAMRVAEGTVGPGGGAGDPKVSGTSGGGYVGPARDAEKSKDEQASSGAGDPAGGVRAVMSPGAEERAVSRERLEERRRVDAVSRLQSDLEDALAKGERAAADGLAEQLEAIRPGSSDPDDRLQARLQLNRSLQEFNTEQYDRVVDNPFTRVADHPLSTFGVDVDTASYANVRRFLTAGQLPPPDAVRIEELVNYFDYDYAAPPTDAQQPFAARVAVSAAPWNPQHRLVRIGIKGKEMRPAERPASNLVFLLDVSGSMNEANKLPLVQRAMTMLAEQLDERDRVAIVVYAGSSGLVLPSTGGDRKELILAALNNLSAGGSTNGAEGIQLAYDTARQGFVKGGVNRVILCTDGDFNVGVTDRGQLTRLIEDEAKSGVYLSLLGFGMGNLKDATMEELADKGDGNYGYVDTEHEARKLLVEQMSGTLVSIAKDVKIQVEFNPAVVGSYRLIGYENRILAKEDFNDDTQDAGDIGAGHEVTALYEVVPLNVAAGEAEARLVAARDRLAKLKALQSLANFTEQAARDVADEIVRLEAEIKALEAAPGAAPAVDDLKYQVKPASAPAAAESGEMLTVKLRYKAPDAPKEQGTSVLVEYPVRDDGAGFDTADADLRHAAAVAGFGMLLRDSPHKGTLTWAGLAEMTGRADAPADDAAAKGRAFESARRAEFSDLVRRAAALSAATAEPAPR